MIKFPKIRLPKVRLPRLPLPKVPGIKKIQTSGVKPVFFVVGVMAVSFTLALFFVINFTGVGAPIWPEAGGSYFLPTSEVGHWLPLDVNEPERQSQTIKVNLAIGAQIDTLSFTDVSLGKTGLTACFQVARDGATTGFLYVGTLTLTGVSAPSFDMANTEVGTLTLAGTADGRTNGATLDNTIGEHVINSVRGAGSFAATDATADMVIINLLGSATVKTLSLTNVACSVGGFDLDWIKAGTIVQDATSRFGTGTGINSPDYVLQSSVLYRISTDGMVDAPVTVK